MPTYDYRCKQCSYEFELYIRHYGDTPGRCPDCGGEVKQVLKSAPAFVGKPFKPYDFLDKGEPTPPVSVRVPSTYKKGKSGE